MNNDRYTNLALLAKTLHASHKDEPLLRKQAIGLICDGIHQCPAIPSGLVSVAAKDRTVSTITKEHFFSRKISARTIFNLYDRGASICRVAAFIKSRCRVHYVTKQENMELVKYQQDQNIKTWREEYKAAGIVLVPYIKKTTKQYVYSIGKIKYINIQDIANEYGVTVEVARYRFSTKAKKWSDWTRERIN